MNPVAVALFLADGGDSPSDIDPTTGHGPEWGEAAPVGLLIIVLMCVALYFLVKSMNRNLKKVPESFGSSDPVSVEASASRSTESGTIVGRAADPGRSGDAGSSPNGSAPPDSPQ